MMGDITTAKVDAIVNAANVAMLGGGGVDGAIHKAAGPELFEECKKVQAENGIRCPVGEARITGAGSIPVKYIVHTVEPKYFDDENPKSLLESAYRNSLKLARQYSCLSVAFPAISCGVYRYPLEEAAEVSVSVCNESEFSGIKKQFYLMSVDLYQLWSRKVADVS